MGSVIESRCMRSIGTASIGRSETIELLDAATNAVLDKRTLTAFRLGRSWTWELGGAYGFGITKTAGQNAVISGVFFGAP